MLVTFSVAALPSKQVNSGGL